MKRLFTFAVALLLVGVVFLGLGSDVWAEHGGGADKSGQTEVSWNVDNCWIKLTVHGSVDLGTITAPDQVLESTSGNEVFVRTNCTRGYVLAVKATDALTPAGFAGNILADFAWKVAQVSGNVAEYQNTYTGFPGFGKEMKVGVAEKPGAAHFQMAYRYTSDDEDIPGDYSITLLYTATSQ